MACEGGGEEALWSRVFARAAKELALRRGPVAVAVLLVQRCEVKKDGVRAAAVPIHEGLEGDHLDFLVMSCVRQEIQLKARKRRATWESEKVDKTSSYLTEPFFKNETL